MVLDQGELTRLAASLGGLPVLACRAGSPAARAGLRDGDIVLAVNGMRTPDWASFLEARLRDPERMHVELFRDGVRLSLEIELPASADFGTSN